MIYAPEWYWKIPEEARKQGRCGPGDGIGEKLVPDSILFMSITEYCQVHDMDYNPEWNPDIQEALKIVDPQKKATVLMRIKDEGDDRFIKNILNGIRERSANGFMRWARNQIAVNFFSAVSIAGNSAFWHNIEEYEGESKLKNP